MYDEVNFLSNAHGIATSEKHIQDATQKTEQINDWISEALQLGMNEGQKNLDENVERKRNLRQMTVSLPVRTTLQQKPRSFRTKRHVKTPQGRYNSRDEERKLFLFGDKVLEDYIEQYPLLNPIPLFKLGNVKLLRKYFKKYVLSPLDEYQMVVTLAMDMKDEIEAEKLISYYIRRHGLHHLGAQNALLDMELFGCMRTLIKYGQPDETVLEKFKVHEETMCMV